MATRNGFFIVSVATLYRQNHGLTLVEMGLIESSVFNTCFYIGNPYGIFM